MHVCVIGTGPSGLTTIKQLLDEGHQVTCFERSDRIGGIWSRHPGDADQMKVFDSLILTISMKLMAFSDFMVEDERVFYSHERYLEYLEAYADRFDLRPRVRFGSTVTRVDKISADRWRVSVLAGGERTEHGFDAVAVCVGPFQTPNLDVAGLPSFTGEVVHSSRYRNNQAFRGRRVLVVGLAESGADILREVAEVASACTLAIRSYSYLLPRLISGRYSTDSSTVRAHHHEMWVRSPGVAYPMRAIFGDGSSSRRLFAAFTRLYGLAAAAAGVASRRRPEEEARDHERRNHLGEPMLPLKTDLGTPWTQENMDAIDEWNRRSDAAEGSWSQRVIYAKNVSFIPAIVDGTIDVKDTGIAGMEGTRVHFADGTSREFDVIVLCTGFVKDFARLGPDLAVRDDNVRHLYKHAFHPDHGGRLAFIGFVRPFSGGIPICAEMQARYFAQLCSDRLALPANVDQRIREEKEWEDRMTALSPGHTESIPSQVFFLDSIAREIGCLMSISALIARPRLLVRHWFYSFNQACYRLIGPHSDPAALASMMRERPGPLGGSLPILLFVALSLMPRSVHPRHTSGPMPGQPRPPGSPARSGRGRHFLSPR